MAVEAATTLIEYLEKVAARTESGQTAWYRGQLDGHVLRPSLYRKNGLLSAEEALNAEVRLKNRFNELARIYYPQGIPDDVRGLMVMQHYRVPTRLLDWSRNPLIGLFFALTAHESNGGKDAAIWLLDPNAWNNKALEAASGPSRPLSVGDPDLRGYIRLKDDGPVPGSLYPVALRGHADSNRIAAQQGAFVLFGNSLDDMEAASSKLSMADGVLSKIVVPESNCLPMLRHLLNIGITDDYVYPDLEGVVSHIRREEGYPI